MHRCRIVVAATTVFLLFTLPARGATADSLKREWLPSPTGAALRSLALPGWGQLYNRSPVKSVIVSGVEEWLLYDIYQEHKLYRWHSDLGDRERAEMHRNQRNRQTWYFTATLLLAVMDAYVDAHLYAFDVSDNLGYTPRHKGISVAGVQLKFGAIAR
jgi:hypothetical protein